MNEVDEGNSVSVGVIADPGLPAELVPALLNDLMEELQRRFPASRWAVVQVVDPLVQSPADSTEIVQAARRRQLAEDWSLAITLTDLPLEVSRRPVVAHASAVHGVGVVSVPALGAVNVRRRVLHAVVRLIETLLGEPEEAAAGSSGQEARSRRLRRRAGQLGRPTSPQPDQTEFRFTARVLSGNIACCWA